MVPYRAQSPAPSTMKWDQETAVTLTEADWCEIKSALWDSRSLWLEKGCEARAEHAWKLRCLINEQMRNSA